MERTPILNMKVWYDPNGLLFTADFGNLTMYGNFSESVDFLSARQDEAVELEGSDYDDALTMPTVPFPTWGEILHAIHTYSTDTEDIAYADRLAKFMDLTDRPETYSPTELYH